MDDNPSPDDGPSAAADRPAGERPSDHARSPGEGSHYRVLGVPEPGRLRVLDRATYEPVVTADDGHDAPVDDVRPGYLVDAALDWSSAEPTVESLSVRRPTLYAFADDVDPVFEVAREAWSDARAVGDAMNSRVTRNTDNEVNGVLYVFADGGATSTFEEFRDGARPVEPLVEKVNDRDGPAPREVFVLRPESREFVVVTIALRKGGRFADTLRDTYDVPRPPEPLA
ncbi:DUF6663 family protein [Halorussus halobius]|uniref:DUF6663 family protein n=1 Tax=Halorussus halobius TaxID=1710537 RepID=UPI001FCF2617|nr:DUF6663 family protein [Halorussus halobius]